MKIKEWRTPLSPIFPRLDSMDARRAGKHAKASRAHNNMKQSIDYEKHAIFSLLTDEEWNQVRGDRFSSYNEISEQWKPGDFVGHYSTTTERGVVLIRDFEIVHRHITACIHCVRPSDHWVSAKRKFDRLGGLRGLISGKFVWPEIGVTLKLAGGKIIL